MERMFKQFTVTFITFQVAVALVRGNSTVLKALMNDRWITEILLDTGAKLVYMEDLDTFGVFSYHYDGRDGYEAVVNAFGGLDHDDPILNINAYDAVRRH